MAATAPPAFPTWDFEVVFPALTSPQYQAALSDFRSLCTRLTQEFDQLKIDGGSRGSIDPSDFDRLLTSLNDAMELSKLLSTYTYCQIDVDSRNEQAQACGSTFDQALVPLRKLRTRLVAFIGTQDVSKLFSGSATATSHRFFIEKSHEAATKQMSPDEEALSADLAITGSVAWGKLHGDITSQIEVEVDGKSVPMSSARTLAYDPARGTREAAYHAELAGWKQWEVPLAAAMNGIKGEVLLLCKRRNWQSPLDEALFRSNIDKATLDAMLAAAQDSMPAFRRYFAAKAKHIGAAQLEWYDIFAPVGKSAKAWDYNEACDFVAEQFDAYSPRLGDFARRSYRERWIDPAPRSGKRDGAYCAGLRADESRILMNFKPSFGSVKTLAHELGHAYHNVCLAQRTPLQRVNPMTLAETASTFCETIIANAGLRHATGDERLSLLEGTLQGISQVVVDITSRYLFESAVFERRAERELSPAELCMEMEKSQRATYGEALSSFHPYMWAVKPHYYSTGSYYNYPYMFGLLFGLGLYARYQADPSSFEARYDDLLSSTGMADAASLGERFGIDIRSKQFWADSLAVAEKDILEFETMVG